MELTEIISLARELCQAPGISGREEDAAAAAEKLLQCAEPYRDARAAMLQECFPTRPMGGFGLTERELEIAQMTAQRRTRREIGDALGISEKTVSNRLTTIYEKLGLDGQTLHKRQALIRILEQSGMQ